MYDFFMRIEEEMAIEEEQLHGIKRQRRNRRIRVGSGYSRLGLGHVYKLYPLKFYLRSCLRSTEASK